MVPGFFIGQSGLRTCPRMSAVTSLKLFSFYASGDGGTRECGRGRAKIGAEVVGTCSYSLGVVWMCVGEYE